MPCFGARRDATCSVSECPGGARVRGSRSWAQWFLVCLAVVFAGGLLVSSAWAWSSATVSGDWQEGSKALFQGNDNDETGLISYSQSMTNFSGVYASINITDLHLTRRNWWDMEANKELWLCFYLNSSSSSINVSVYIKFSEYTNTWGLIKDKMVASGLFWNCTSDEAIFNRYVTSYQVNNPVGYGTQYFSNYDPLNRQYFLELYLSREGDGLRMRSLWNRGVQDPNLLVNSTLALPHNFFETCTLYLFIKHKGSGSFSGMENDVIYDNVPFSPSLPETTGPSQSGFFGTLVHDLYSIATSILPKSIVDTVLQFGQWAGTMGVVAFSFLGALTVVLPMVPLIMLFYAFDVGISSVRSGSFKPVGDFMHTIYSVLAGVVGVIVSVASTIYQYIKWW